MEGEGEHAGAHTPPLTHPPHHWAGIRRLHTFTESSTAPAPHHSVSLGVQGIHKLLN